MCSSNHKENKIMENLIKNTLQYSSAKMQHKPYILIRFTPITEDSGTYITGPLSCDKAVAVYCTCGSIPACFAPGVRLAGVVYDMSALI